MNNHGYTMLFYCISYFLFFGILLLSKEKNANRLFDKNGLISDLRILIVLHIIGIILFGILPAFTKHLFSFALYNSFDIKSLPTWITALLIIIVIINTTRFVTKNYGDVAPRSSITTSFNVLNIKTYLFARIIFICVYESWFRGYLLNDCIISFGAPVAILLNIIFYTLLHLVNGKAEALACIPFGLILCGLCLWQRSVWPAIVIHLALTLSYEISFLQQMKKYKTQRNESFNNRGIRLYRK